MMNSTERLFKQAAHQLRIARENLLASMAGTHTRNDVEYEERVREATTAAVRVILDVFIGEAADQMSERVSPAALTAAMDNVVASRLGEIARQAGNPNRSDVGDGIDRGLILLRLLNEGGFVVFDKAGEAR
jgi:hypothetical protein